jgi:hypothetical protein
VSIEKKPELGRVRASEETAVREGTGVRKETGAIARTRARKVN